MRDSLTYTVQQLVSAVSGGHTLPVAAATAEGEGQDAACPRPVLVLVLAFRETQAVWLGAKLSAFKLELSLMPARRPWASPLASLCLHFWIVPASCLRPLRASSRCVTVEVASPI